MRACVSACARVKGCSHLAQHRVDCAAEDLGVLAPHKLLLLRLGRFGVVRDLETLALELRDRGL